MRKRSPQEQHQAPSHPQTNQFHNLCRLANSAFANKSQKTTSFFNPHNITRTPINYNTYSHNPIPPYSHSWTSSSPNPNSETHNLSRQHTTVRTITLQPFTILPSEWSARVYSNRIHTINIFYTKKIINLQHQLDNTAGENGSARGGNKFTGAKQD